MCPFQASQDALSLAIIKPPPLGSKSALVHWTLKPGKPQDPLSAPWLEHGVRGLLGAGADDAIRCSLGGDWEEGHDTFGVVP